LSVDDEKLVAEDSFVRALVKGGEFTKKQAAEMLETLREQGEVVTPNPHHLKRSQGMAESRR
jgi:hypothetical protein